MTTTHLLTTKTYIPPRRPGLISRQRLLDQLSSGLNQRLILVAAPAGFGKTTLLGEWISKSELTFCWLSLDRYDNGLNRFLAYLFNCLKSIDVAIDAQVLERTASKSDPITTVLIPVINQISQLERRFALVLDDYHLIHNTEIHQAILYLLDNQPPNMHLIIASRTDPPLRLAQYRARGELCEIRAQDLRFNRDEAIRFLNTSLKLGLSTTDVETLLMKTEGWITGLQLAAISLQKNQDRHQFVTAFAGYDRYIADYLLDEALRSQPPQLQDFLMKTAILDRLNASLCNAVIGGNDSQEVLWELERANLFLIPLDNIRNWYRYHHLFADLLKKRLSQTQAVNITELHKRASQWYEGHDLLPDAINHALAINDIERIAELTEAMAVDKMELEELNTLLAWLDRLPKETYHRHPWMLVTRTWAHFNTGEYKKVTRNLIEIETILAHEHIPQELKTRIQGHVAAIRTYLAELQEDAESTLRQAEAALALLTGKDTKLRAFLAIRKANCLAWFGDIEQARRTFQEVGEIGKRTGDAQLAITALSEMAAVQMVAGNLKQAVQTITELKIYAEELAQEAGRRVPAMAKLYFHLSHIKHEQNELAQSLYYAKEAVKISQQWGEKEAIVYSLRALARAYDAHGDTEKTTYTLEQLQQIAAEISPTAQENVRDWALLYYLKQGKLEEAAGWAENLDLGFKGKYSHNLLYKGGNLTRYQIAKGKYAQGLETITALLKFVDTTHIKGYAIRLHILKALLLQKIGEEENALEAIAAALSLAHLQGYIRCFLDEGEAVASLLYLAAQRDIYPAYCQQLLDEFEKQPKGDFTHPKSSRALIETLSDREVEVLQHIARGATNQEIARELILSLHTIKSHTRNIYGKLGVKNRTEAVARARLLGLLPKD